MQSLMRLVCIGYLVFLTALLVVEDPLRLVGASDRAPGFWQTVLPWAHFLSFFLLAGLVLTTRWPVPRWLIVLLMLLYAGTTEVAQSFLPPRRAEWVDWLQDVAGIMAGAAVCWIMATGAAALTSNREPTTSCDGVGLSEEWKLLHTVISRTAPPSESWWK